MPAEAGWPFFCLGQKTSARGAAFCRVHPGRLSLAVPIFLFRRERRKMWTAVRRQPCPGDARSGPAARHPAFSGIRTVRCGSIPARPAQAFRAGHKDASPEWQLTQAPVAATFHAASQASRTRSKKVSTKHCLICFRPGFAPAFPARPTSGPAFRSAVSTPRFPFPASDFCSRIFHSIPGWRRRPRRRLRGW